ncbi:MAG: WD40 repeat domain-containing protein [Symploca sp. SIO1A3]|nr:WD40 repeat domain-containing protein [Symploca sp. SIO1A3]
MFKTPSISGETIQKLLHLLRPYLQDEGERKAFLFRALGFETVERLNLVWKQPTNTFIPELLKELVNFGEIVSGQPALCALLKVIREDVGVDVQSEIDKLIFQIKQELNTLEPNHLWQDVQTFKGHSELIRSVAISPDGQILASGSIDQTIKLWNLATGKLLDTLEGHSSAVLSVAFHPDGKTLAGGSNLAVGDGNLKLWDVKTGTLQRVLDQGLINFRVSCVTFSPDGQTLATGNIDATIKLWKLSSGKLYRTLKGHGWDVASVAFSRDGRLLVSGGFDGAIKIWNWRTGELLHTLNRPSPSNIIGSLVSWFDSSVGAIYSVAISPDGQMIASAGSDQLIILWNSGTGKLVRTLTEHSGSVFAVAFSPKGKFLASGGKDNTVRIWNYQTGELLQTLEHFGLVHCLAFSPDGETLASGSEDTTIKVWRINNS